MNSIPDYAGTHQTTGSFPVTSEFKTEDAWMDEQMQSPMTHGQDEHGKSPKGSGKLTTKRLSQCMTPTSCQLCSRVYSNVSNLRQHMRLIHNPAPVICPVCTYSCKTLILAFDFLFSFFLNHFQAKNTLVRICISNGTTAQYMVAEGLATVVAEMKQ